jgi:hypothetical protein
MGWKIAARAVDVSAWVVVFSLNRCRLSTAGMTARLRR